MVKICMFLYGPLETDGRVQRSILMLQECLDVKITLISCGSNTMYKMKNINHINLPIKIGGINKYFRFIYKSFIYILKNNNSIDIYYLHDFFSLILSAFIHKKKIIYDAHELIVRRKKENVILRDKFFILIEKLCVNKISLVITANIERAKVMKYIYNISNITYILNITNAELLKNNRKRADGKIILVYAGAITEERGLDIFVRVVNRLNNNYVLNFIGTGPYESNLRQLAKDLNCLNKVKFMGRLSNLEMMNELKESDIGLISYPFTDLNNIYCSPNKIFEYASQKLPVVSTCQPTIANIIKKYNIGRTFNSEQSCLDSIINISENFNYYNDKFERLFEDYSYLNESKRLKTSLKNMLLYGEEK